MGNKEIVKQMIDFHKTSFENCFSMMATIQDQAEKLFKTFVDQTPGMSDESKKVMVQWSSAYKKGIDDLKKAMDEGCAKVETFFDNNAMVMFQEQTEKMFNSFLNQANWMPQDLKKTMEELAATYKKGCDEFKKYVDENIWRMEYFSPVTNKSQTKTKQKK
jgi:Na+-transporting NADH:ubiquinone oxidoreductase subunit NqrA